MSTEIQFPQFLQGLKEFLTDSENAVEDSVPEGLLLFVRESGIDPRFRWVRSLHTPTHFEITHHFREEQAQLISTWLALAECFTIGYEKLAEANAVGIHRTLNGAIMLGRNLVSVSKAGTYAWDSGAPARIIDIMKRILESHDRSPSGKWRKVKVWFF